MKNWSTWLTTLKSPGQWADGGIINYFSFISISAYKWDTLQETLEKGVMQTSRPSKNFPPIPKISQNLTQNIPLLIILARAANLDRETVLSTIFDLIMRKKRKISHQMRQSTNLPKILGNRHKNFI